MKKITIVVTGSDGQLGQELQAVHGQFPSFDFRFCSREDLDITNGEELGEKLSAWKPSFIINAAAYTAVDQAETDEEKAFQVNTAAVEKLAKICKKKEIWLMHVSSDYVYHHNPDRPLNEADETYAQGAYARTKLKGDQAIQDIDPMYCIVRTSWVYSSFGKNFVKSMTRLGNERDSLNIVSDQIGTPTYARDLAVVLCQMIQIIAREAGDKEQYTGIYNYSNAGATNWAEFAEEIFNIQGISCEIHPITTEEFGAPAPRPKWSLLDKNKISSIFNIEIKSWKTSLKACIELLKSS